jgi:hypothetical protein
MVSISGEEAVEGDCQFMLKLAKGFKITKAYLSGIWCVSRTSVFL